MALDIVTAYQGMNHVTADQMADFQRGILGDSCILPVGNKMKVNIQTANQITVADGVAVYDGREIHIPYGSSENVAITSGTQGMMRNDIVCLQYNRDESSGVESVEFVTIAGTPVASNPQDPAYSNLDIRTGVFMSQKPFCRVRLNGTAIEGIDMLVDVYDTGWIYPHIDSPFNEYSSFWRPRYRKIGRFVNVIGAVKPEISITGGITQYTIFTLPEGFRPAVEISELCQGSELDSWHLDIKVTGELMFSRLRAGNSYKDATQNMWLPFNATFPAE